MMSTKLQKNRKLLISSYQPYTVAAVAKFAEDYQWYPAVWFVADENRELVAEAFPETLSYDFFDVVKGCLPDWLCYADIAMPTPEDLRILSEYEYNFLYMLERNDSNSAAFEYKERLAFYYRVLGLWKHIVTKYEIDLIWFEEEPHQAVDYALYLVAKLLNVETVLTSRTTQELGILPYREFEVGYPQLNLDYQNLVDQFQRDKKASLPICESIEQYFGKMNADYETILKEHLWDQVEEYKRLSGSKRFSVLSSFKGLSKYRSLIGVTKRFVMNTPIRSDQFKAGHSMMDSSLSYREYAYFKLRAIRKKRKMKAVYDRLAIDNLAELPNGKKIVYVALQYQPEKSTCPLAGRFVDQRYMIEFLRTQLDDSWHIVVKEHPSQFISSYTRFGECFRDEGYYQKLDGLPNVSLLSLKLNSFDIMAVSKTVASAGGTVCWEAAARGLPSLSFAYSWFRPCHGIFFIQSQAQLTVAIQSIENGFTPSGYLVKAFAQLIKNYGFHAAIGGNSSLEYKGITLKANAQAHFNAIKSLLSSPIN